MCALYPLSVRHPVLSRYPVITGRLPSEAPSPEPRCHTATPLASIWLGLRLAKELNLCQLGSLIRTCAVPGTHNSLEATPKGAPQASVSQQMNMKLPEYKQHKDHDAIINGAYFAIKSLLALDLDTKLKRELIDVCIWKITEVDGKYHTRYRSEGSLHITDRSKLHHEHVVERRDLIDALLDNPGSYKSILDTAVGCVVTREEHALLTSLSKKTPSLHGWARYKAANIKVYDLMSKNEIAY